MKRVSIPALDCIAVGSATPGHNKSYLNASDHNLYRDGNKKQRILFDPSEEDLKKVFDDMGVLQRSEISAMDNRTYDFGHVAAA